MTKRSTAPRAVGRTGGEEEVARLVLKLKRLVAVKARLEAGGASRAELDGHLRAIEHLRWRLAEVVKQAFPHCATRSSAGV